MPKLAIFELIEDEIVGQTWPRERSRMGPIPKFSIEEAPTAKVYKRDVVDFRLQLGVRVNIRSGDNMRAQRRICELFGEALFNDLLKEIGAMRDWVFTEGIGEDVEKRLERLEKLCYGLDVPPLESGAGR